MFLLMVLVEPKNTIPEIQLDLLLVTHDSHDLDHPENYLSFYYHLAIIIF